MAGNDQKERDKHLALATEVFSRLMVKLRADPSRRPALRRAAEQATALEMAAIRKGQKPSSVGELVDRAMDLLAAPRAPRSPSDPFPSDGTPPPEIPGPFEQVLLESTVPSGRLAVTDSGSTFSELLPPELGTVTEPAEEWSGAHPVPDQEPEEQAVAPPPQRRRRARTPVLAFVAIFAVAAVVALAAYLWVQRSESSEWPRIPFLGRGETNQRQASGDPRRLPPSSGAAPMAAATPEATAVPDTEPDPGVVAAPPVTTEPTAVPPAAGTAPTAVGPTVAVAPTEPPQEMPATAPAAAPTPTPPPPLPAATTGPLPTPLPPEVRAGFRQTKAAEMVSPDWQGRPPAYVLHFSSYRDRAKAEADARRLSAELGRPGFVATVDLGAEGVWHRVVLGGFASEDDALAVRERLADRQTPGLGHVYRVSGPR